jgi:hypothetical protein
MQRLLRRACRATNLAREQGVPLKPGLIALIERCYDGIVAEGMAFHKGQPVLVKTGRPPPATTCCFASPNFHTCQAALLESPQNTMQFASPGKNVVLNLAIF